MRVEVNERHWPMLGCYRPKSREGDSVITTEGYDRSAIAHEGCKALLHVVQSRFNIKGVGIKVAGIDHLCIRKGHRFKSWIVWSQET